MIDFKGSQYPKGVILCAVFFYVRYAASDRNLEEIMAERGVEVDHATLNRWIVKYSPIIAPKAQRQQSKAGSSWRRMKHILRSKVSGLTITVPSIRTVKLLISYYLSNAMPKQFDVFSNKPLILTKCQTK